MRRLIPIVTFLILSGCATLTDQMGFQEVNDTFSSRTGRTLYWRTGSEEDRKIDGEIAKLLAADLTVDGATQIALLNNKGLQATYQRLGIAQADLVQAGLLPNPIFNGEIRFPSEGPNLELSVVQSFIKIFQIPLRKKIAQSEFEVTKMEVIEKALELSYNVRKAFYQYQASHQLLELSQTGLIALEASKDLADRMHRAGNITDLDRALKQSDYEALKLEIASHKEELVAAREVLNSLLGLEVGQINWTAQKGPPEQIPTAEQFNHVEKKSVDNNLALARGRQNFRTLARSLDLAENFRVFGDTELGITGAKEAEGTWGFGPAFSLPLPFFNQGQAEIFRTNAQLQQQYDAIADMQIRIDARMRALIQQLQIVESRLANYKKSLLPLQAKVVSETHKQYNAMLIGAFQLLDVKYNEIEMGKDYVSTLKSYWLLRAEIESAVNGLVPSLDLQEASTQ